MARKLPLQKQIEEYEEEDPLAGSPLDSALQDRSYDEILSQPPLLDAPETSVRGRTPRVPRPKSAKEIVRERASSSEGLDSTFDADELKTAQRKDKKSAAWDSASDALYAAFSRQPIRKLSSTPSEADAVGQRQDLARKARGESRQASEMARSAKERKATRAAVEKSLGLKPGALDGISDAGMEKITGIKMKEREAAAAGAAAERERLQAEADYQRGRGDKRTDTGEERAWREKQDALDRASRERAAALSAGGKTDEKIGKQAQDLGKDLEGTAVLKDSFDAIDGAMAAAPGAGIGPWDARKPEIFDSKQDTVVKQALKRIVATILKKQSGAGVTEAEYDRTLAGYGINPNSTEDAFHVGYGAMKRAAVAAARESEAKVSPEAVKRYQDRGGVTSGKLGGAGPGGGTAAPPWRRKAYSPSTKKTYLIDASGKKVGEEEGDTRGR